MQLAGGWSKGHWLTPIVWPVSQSLTKVRAHIFFTLASLHLCTLLIFPHQFLPVPQPSSKPSPSKRSRSGENLQPAAGEENQKPVLTTPIATTLTDPPTDKKPPAGPASIRSSSSLEKTATRHAVRSQPQETKTAQPESKEKAVTPAPDPLSSRETEMVSAISAPQRNKEDLVEDAAPSAVGMRSRLQRLAEQRKGWDGSGEKHLCVCYIFNLFSSLDKIILI